jgi:prepilin-type N-terminal cleavage/methylation domain-containing protein
MTMNQRGFTLIELLVGVVLTGIVGGSIYLVLLNSQRVYTLQTERAAMNQNSRAAVAILPSEFRELSVTDAYGSDITDMDGTSIEYKAMRSLWLVCAQPVDNGNNGTVIVESQGYGVRWWFDLARDSALVFAEGSATSRADNIWVHANIATSTYTANGCRGGRPGYILALNNVEPANGLGRVHVGAALRGFEMMRLSTYTDVNGDVWLGAQNYVKNGGWATLQPVLGPLAGGGLALVYTDENGNVTSNRDAVAHIGLTVIGQTQAAVRGSSGMARAVDTLVTATTLRNNARN